MRGGKLYCDSLAYGYKIIWNSEKTNLLLLFLYPLTIFAIMLYCGYLCVTLAYRIMYFIVIVTQLHHILPLGIPEFRTSVLLPQPHNCGNFLPVWFKFALIFCHYRYSRVTLLHVPVLQSAMC